MTYYYHAGNPTFQNALFGSRLFIDDDLPEINDFRKSFIARTGSSSSSQGGSQISCQRVNSVREEFLFNTKKSTIDEIVGSTEV